MLCVPPVGLFFLMSIIAWIPARGKRPESSGSAQLRIIQWVTNRIQTGKQGHPPVCAMLSGEKSGADFTAPQKMRPYRLPMSFIIGRDNYLLPLYG